MKRRFGLPLLLLTLGGSPAEGQSVLDQMQQEVVAIVRSARGGVVTIEEWVPTEPGPVRSGASPDSRLRSEKEGAVKGEPVRRQSTAKRGRPGKIGSGFVIEPGFVVTTADVLEGMRQPIVVSDTGDLFRAVVVQVDHELNIGLLRLPATATIHPIKVGTSSNVQPGQFAIVIGNQAGQANAAAITLVSGWRREGSFAGPRFYPTLMQVAGGLGAGSSGAPLLNSRAEVIGMLVAVSRGAGEGGEGGLAGGYALPIDDVRTAARQMTNVKLYLRGWLGADLREEARVRNSSDGTVAIDRNVWVEVVHTGSPAEKAGMRSGDRFITMNGEPVRRMGDIRTAVVRLRPGQELRFMLRRGTSDVTAVVPFGMRPRQF